MAAMVTATATVTTTATTTATMVSPPRWQGRGETARQGRLSMIDVAGVLGEG